MSNIRRAVAAAAAGIMLTVCGVVVATPAQADSEVAKLVCGFLKLGYDPAQLKGCEDLED
ncbi:hypothetical protein AB0L26_23525 [Streptomyces nondiastaticus]|uniref:hypothetical protein n=1 Tax=Streptomyces TaxID=1883 RepID=UPI0026750B31|nr:hypothetical protein [Streptomyces sp. VNUA116]WKU43092.1 hypothetical protein Q3V23_02845 [Streptomyces sp. VNUA116]